MSLVEVRLAEPDETPVVILKEIDGPRHLAVWVSAVGAAAIVSAAEGEDPEHPGTHDLILDIIDALEGSVLAARITAVDDGQFYADIVVDGGEVAARPSDAIAIAIRCGAPILCHEDVLDRVGIHLTAIDSGAAQLERPEDEVAEFRAFLESVNPDDF